MRQFLCCATVFLLAFSLAACDGDSDSGSGITAVTAGTGLSGGGNAGEVTLSADTDYLQRRVDDLCLGDTAVKSIADDGTVACSAEMSLASHNHDADYAASDHNHDGVYSPVDHEHAGVYAVAAHDHDDRYFPKASFTGSDYNETNQCADATGYFVIGVVQDEFGCRDNCNTICQRHGLTCDQVRDHTGTLRTCTYVANSAALYCWCKG